MGTVLVMSEASYRDSGDDANSVDKNTPRSAESGEKRDEDVPPRPPAPSQE